MALVWSDLSSVADRERRDELRELARAVWHEESMPGRRAALRRLDQALWLESFDAGISVRYESRPSRPLAELVAAAAPDHLAATVGQRRVAHDAALQLARELDDVDLSTSRVRVGVTRGHLFEVVFSVPLDVSGGEEDLQAAAERYLESVLGERCVDDWVASVGVVRSPRTRGFLVVRESSVATDYPIESTCELLERGIFGISSELPQTLLRPEGSSWTALDMQPTDSGPQAERVFASTTQPEALKAALEGLPFHSARFTRGDEVFVWLALARRSTTSQSEREASEARVQSFCDEGAASLIGSGFGRELDYLDLVIRNHLGALQGLLRALELAPHEGDGAAPLGWLGFYDSCWADEVLPLSRRR
jgi:hypothetical protein